MNSLPQDNSGYLHGDETLDDVTPVFDEDLPGVTPNLNDCPLVTGLVDPSPAPSFFELREAINRLDEARRAG